jgi:hypothetical protein
VLHRTLEVDARVDPGNLRRPQRHGHPLVRRDHRDVEGQPGADQDGPAQVPVRDDEGDQQQVRHRQDGDAAAFEPEVGVDEGGGELGGELQHERGEHEAGEPEPRPAEVRHPPAARQPRDEADEQQEHGEAHEPRGYGLVAPRPV